MSALIGWMHRALLRTAHPIARLWWRITRPQASGAYVVVCRDRDTPREAWLFVRNSYKPGLTLPGGGIARGESPHAAGLRETVEEVGVKLAAERLRATRSFVIEYQHRLDHVHFFEFELAEDEAIDAQPDGLEVVWADFIELQCLDTEAVVAPVRRYLDERGPAGGSSI
jgi:8-oxo-dGTP pyrophosphatase MutT (NUDIX family)